MDQWKSDADRLSSILPADLPITGRLEYLLHSVAQQGIEVNAAIFDQDSTLPIAPETFLAIDRDALNKSNSQLGEFARNLQGAAFVATSVTQPSVLVLPQYDSMRPLGNGLILTHELEHITQRREGFGDASIGTQERRAYRTNIDTIVAVDGTDFKKYIDQWPNTLTQSENSTELSFHDTKCPEPPKETFMHDVWKEGGVSQTLLQSIGRTAVFENIVLGLPENVIDQLADGLVA